MAIPNTHSDNELFETDNFRLSARSYFWVFVIVIVILLLLLLHNYNKNTKLRAALKTKINGLEKFVI